MIDLPSVSMANQEIITPNGIHETATHSHLDDRRHVLRSNGVHSSAGRIEIFHCGTESSQAGSSNDDTMCMMASKLTSPHFAFTPTSDAIPYAENYAVVPVQQILSDSGSQRQRCQSASTSQTSSLGAQTLASVQFSVEATRVAATNLKRQEQLWMSEAQTGCAEAMQLHLPQSQNGKWAQHRVDPPITQMPIHHPDFDLDTFLNAHISMDFASHSPAQAQAEYQQSLAQQQTAQLVHGFHEAEIPSSQVISGHTTLMPRGAETVLADPSVCKELFASIPLLPSSIARKEGEGKPQFKDPFVNPILPQRRVQTDEVNPVPVIKKSPSSTPENNDLRTYLDVRASTKDGKKIDEAKTAELTSQFEVKDKSSEPTEEAISPNIATQRVKAIKSKRAQPARPRVIKAKPEGRKGVAPGSRTRASAIAKANTNALPVGTVKCSILSEEKKIVEGEQSTRPQDRNSEQATRTTEAQTATDASTSSSVDASQAGATIWSQAIMAQQTLATNTGTEVYEDMQRDLEMILRQDLALKPKKASAIRSGEVDSAGRDENVLDENSLHNRANWRPLVHTLMEDSAHKQDAASTTYDYLARLPMLSGHNSTTPLHLNEQLIPSRVLTPFLPVTQDAYDAVSASSSARLIGEANAVNSSAEACQESRYGAPASEKTAVIPSASISSAQFATCFFLAQDKRTGELGWITDLRGTAADEPMAQFPIRPLMNGVLAQLHNEWLSKHPVTMANRAASVDRETINVSSGEGASTPLLPPGNFPAVLSTTASVHIRTLWRDLERRRYLFANDDRTLNELQRRAEQQLRYEDSRRAGYRPTTIQELWSVSTRPGDMEVAKRALCIWERARTAATYSLGLLRQAEYCIAQSEICFAPMCDWDSEAARARTSALDPRQKSSKVERKNCSVDEGAEDWANERGGKRQRMSQESVSSGSRSGSDGVLRSNGLTSSTSVSETDAGSNSTNSAKVSAALMRLASSSANPKTLPPQ